MAQHKTLLINEMSTFMSDFFFFNYFFYLTIEQPLLMFWKNKIFTILYLLPTLPALRYYPSFKWMCLRAHAGGVHFVYV